MVVTAYEYQRLLKDYDYSIDVQSIKEKKITSFATIWWQNQLLSSFAFRKIIYEDGEWT